jgi:transcription initiation factor TFIIF subunit beta
MSQPNAASVKEKKTSDKDLDLSNCNRGVWLVKVPKYIADRWESVEPNATVGKVKLAKRPGEKPLITLSLDDKIVAERNDTQNAKNGASNGSVKSVTSGISNISTTQQKIPKDHKFVVSTISSQHMAVFSHTAGTSAGPTSPLPPCSDKLSLEGVVAQRAECTPVSNTDKMYMRLKKEALLKPVTMSRKTVHLSQVVNSYKPIARHAANIKYEEKKKAEGKEITR